VHYITFSTRKGGYLTPAERGLVLDVLRQLDDDLYELHAAVVMPDHSHAMVQPAEIDHGEFVSLSKVAHRLKGASAHAINQHRDVRGAIWASERMDRVLRNEKEYEQKLRYILTNPVKAGLVSRWEDYPWIYMAPKVTLGL